MASRSAFRTLSTVGVVLLVVAVLSPFVVLPRLKVIPSPISSTTHTRTAPAVVLDEQAFSEGTPLPQHTSDPECAAQPAPVKCFVAQGVPVRGTREISTVDPSTKKLVTLRVESRLEDTARADAPVIAESVDTVTVNRFSAEPDSERTGLQYRFPFDTERRSYPFFDTTAQTDNLIDFADAVKQHGTTALEFSQDVGAINLADSVEAPARRWYSEQELSAAGIHPDETITMSRYYSVVRTVRAEPKTGIIVYVEELLNYFFARSDEEAQTVADSFFDAVETNGAYTPSPHRTALFTTAQWDQATQDAQWEVALRGYRTLNRLEFAIYVMGTLGVAMIIAAMFLLRRRH